MAIASLVSSLLGWLCVIGPVLGLIFGFISLNQIKQSGQSGRGLAIAGIIIGALVIVGGIIYWIIVMIAASNTQTTLGRTAAVIITIDQPPIAAASPRKTSWRSTYLGEPRYQLVAESADVADRVGVAR